MFTEIRTALLLILATASIGIPQVFGQQPQSKAQAALDQAAQQGKYSFVLFYKQNDAATSAMNTTLHQALAKRSSAVVTFVQVADPAERALVAKHDVARAPMPVTLALAPNGALTGIFAQKLQAADVENAFVTPTMMLAMKALQENKLVFVTVQGSSQNIVPPALREFQSDPHFNTRMVTLNMNAADPAEARFAAEMGVDPRAAATQLSLLAPPGVLVGKFAASTAKNSIAAAIAEAGKCCDDPNCKHHQPANGAAPPGAPAAKR